MIPNSTDFRNKNIPLHEGHATNEIFIHCLVNASRTLKHPKQKVRRDDKVYYDHRNYKARYLPLDNVIAETLFKGYQLIPGEFKYTPKHGIRSTESWRSQQLFLIEFDDVSEKTLHGFINARPFIKANAWCVVESIRSRYDDPDDEKCNGQLRPRIVFCMPQAVTTLAERQWIYDALEKELTGCDTGSANSVTNGGFGRVSAESIEIGKIIDPDWFEGAITLGKQRDEAKKRAEHQRTERLKRKQAARAAMGFTEREGELPLNALAKTDPAAFLETIGLTFKSEKGKYQRWGRPQKPNDIALSVWLSDHGNWQIRVFANSIPVPPAANGAMSFTRFYCYHELHTDIEASQPDTKQWKSINAHLAAHGYGTWLPDTEFHAQNTQKTKPIDTPRPDSTVQRRIDEAPPIEARETPSFPYFSKEERRVVDEVLGISPDAGWHGHTPVFVTQYEHLYKLTNTFAPNGHPSEIENRRVWSTRFGNCEICGAPTAKWIDRYQLTAGSYCEGCHTDSPIGSYLELELLRKLPNAIESDYHGFLGDDPEFQDFRLWEPKTFTHLGAAMSTGKSTEIYRSMIGLALQGLGKGIIAVPRVSLARFLAHYLRRRDGYRAWGVWHEGVESTDRVIGEYGAIVCLPSLPRAVQSAIDVGVKNLYIAIDEVDFAYNLLSISIEQATAIKKCLRDVLRTTGLVVSGQTESTLALEALASELESEQVQGFYNTAPPSDGSIVMHRHADVRGKSDAVVVGTIDDISEFLSAGHNVYAFCSSRRDGDIIAATFADLNPVLYNAYTKGDKRADAILKNQKLTDSPLFIGTSAAGIGISILDPNARTVTASRLNYGSRDVNMIAQVNVRDRGRRGGSLHYAAYKLSLPVKPTENETTNLYHEALKIAENKHSHLPENSIKKIARAEALASLADHQIETFITHHLGTVGNMPVHQASALRPSENKIVLISKRRQSLIRTERKKKVAHAIRLLKTRSLLTSSQIRVRSNKGEISPDEQLAHETANAYAAAVGWKDTGNLQLDETDIHTAVALAEKGINAKKLAKQRRGYIAAHFPNWTASTLQTALANTESDLVDNGLGIEPTAIDDDRFRGEFLQVLLDRLDGKVFDVSSLATAIREVFKKKRTMGRTFIGEILRGALGSREYRKARFLSYADDERIVKWASEFISEWYPARIQKRDPHFGLIPAKNLHLRLASFQRWLRHQPRPPDNIPTHLDISFQPTELPDPNAALKNMVRFRREGGETLKSIAVSLNRHENTISTWCEGIKPLSPAQSDVLGILSDGKVWKTSDIVKHSRFTHQNVSTAIKKLVDTGAISRMKRGHYQKK